MAGYSSTPLAKKLGIVAEHRVYLIGAPDDYQALLAPLAPGVEFVDKADARVQLVHVFSSVRADLGRTLGRLRKVLASDAAVWVSWPKKAAKVPTDITEHVVRELALPLGFVDVKVCAVTEIWSGLKLVVRKELR